MPILSPAPEPKPAPAKRWWREQEVAWLVLLVLAAYFSRAGVLPLRGEEPTRAQIAFEMVKWHDWVVPREQGEPFLIRPPLQNWVIAASCLGWGSWDAWAVRFPSVLATLLTTLLVYGYARVFLSRVGALAAAVAFATFADMFQMGRQAETEALFILLVSGSLLIWHWGLMRRWPDAATYAAAYSLMALGMLTKGIQAPAYFLTAITGYLVLTGQWRRLFCRGHLVGALVGAAVLLAWIIPYSLAMGWPAVWTVWMGDPAVTHNSGIAHWQPAEFATHLLTYPVEILAGTLPWSVFLVLYLRRDFRRSIGEAHPHVLFLSISMVIAFLTCWIPPGGLPRYFAPMFPCLAILIGLAIQRSVEALALPALRAAWHRYVAVVACVMALASAAVVVLALVGPGHRILEPWAESPLLALAYAVVSAALALLVLRARATAERSPLRLAVLALAAFLAITFTGIITDGRLRRSENATAAIQRLKERLPPGQPLVSLDGHMNSLFVYLYGEPIVIPGQGPNSLTDPGLTYFCFESPGDSRPSLPFAWEEIDAVPLDRNQNPIPDRVAVVGRRLSSFTPPTASTDPTRSE